MALAKRKHQGVLHRFLGQVMIDAKDLLLVEMFVEGGVQRNGRGQVAAKGFFHHDPRPALGSPSFPGKAGLAEQFGDHRIEPRRHGQVEDAVAAGPLLPVKFSQEAGQFLKAWQVIGDGLVVEAGGKFRPSLPGCGAGRQLREELFPELAVGQPERPQPTMATGSGSLPWA